MKFDIIDPSKTLGTIEKEEIVDFLHEHLDEYNDTKKAIGNALDYAMKINSVDGGFILVGRDNGKIVGIVVINRTGMKWYIPENILVYIAVDKNERGKGYGKKLMNKAIEHTKGNIALHVESDNPARFLYEKVGFENKYLEYRLYK